MKPQFLAEAAAKVDPKKRGKKKMMPEQRAKMMAKFMKDRKK